MRNLIAFIVKNCSWFLLIFLEVISFYLIFQYSSYPKSVFFNSSNEVIGKVYTVSGNFVSYFGLRETNQDLLEKNAYLQNKVISLENYVHSLSVDSLKTEAILKDSIEVDPYNFIIARVIGNSVLQAQNYIRINKGSNAGITADMGVISQQGIVGIVIATTPNFSLIQPVINPKTILNCKIKGSNAPGSLVWDAQDYRYANLEDFPRHEKFEAGDTIVTSGYSQIFPEGIMVGIVEGFEKQKDDNLLILKVRLSTDFATLKDVLIIENKYRQEFIDLDKKITND